MDDKIKIATRQSYGEALRELGKENKNIVVFDADLSCATKTNIFAKQFPDRFFNARDCRTRYDIYCSRNGNMWKNIICKYICCFCGR